jgi:hypothetical protein
MPVFYWLEIQPILITQYNYFSNIQSVIPGTKQNILPAIYFSCLNNIKNRNRQKNRRTILYAGQVNQQPQYPNLIKPTALQS